MSEKRCLVCNGLGGHEDGCRGTAAYDEITALLIKAETLLILASPPPTWNPIKWRAEVFTWLEAIKSHLEKKV